MKQTTTKRTVIVLIMMMLTTMTAWADNPEWLKQGDSWDAATKTLTVNTNPAQDAYSNKNDIEHVIISNNVTSIGQNAFVGCSNLATVTNGDNVSDPVAVQDLIPAVDGSGQIVSAVFRGEQLPNTVAQLSAEAQVVDDFFLHRSAGYPADAGNIICTQKIEKIPH